MADRPTVNFTTARGTSTYVKVDGVWKWDDNGTLRSLSENRDSPTPALLDRSYSARPRTEVLSQETKPIETASEQSEQPVAEVSDPVAISGILVDVSTFDDDELSDLLKENQTALDLLNDGFSTTGSFTSEEQKRVYEAVLYNRQILLQEAAKRNPNCVKKESDNSYTFADTPECEQFSKSVLGNNLAALAQKKYSLPNPCGTSEMAKINTELQKFFITLKGIKKYGNL
jgi:hypothetical protein